MVARLVGLALGCVLLVFGAAAGASAKERLSVDFGHPLARASMVGLLAGMDRRNPPDHRIEPLAPALWRGKLQSAPYSRVRDLGGRYTYVLSDRWGYPGDGVRAPYEDFAAWERLVRDTARRAAARGAAGVWDVWNEPDHPHFWRGTREQYYETYRIAENILRQELGEHVQVAGPSISAFKRDWITGLLNWCGASGCEVNVISWHEFPGGPIPAIERHLRDVRANMLESRRYRPLDIEEIHVNETLSEHDTYRPGELLGHMYYLEAGEADAAARSCWPDSTGQSNCSNNTLDGLLEPHTWLPRSAWWATKAYADGTGSRRLTRSSDDYLVGLASARSDLPHHAQLLVAHLERRPVPKHGNRRRVDVDITLRALGRLPWLRRRRALRVQIERFPNTGEQPLPAPWRRAGVTRPIKHGTARLTLHHVALHEAYRLRIGAP
jgi:xylan 1,4-beta-xylosidase